MSSMRFRNFGGIHQFVVTDADDLARINDLDPARWAATSAPIQDLHCDAEFLKYLDPERTGRVRVSQIVAARDWAFARIARKDVFKGRHAAIALDAISKDAEGNKLRAAAERVNREQKIAGDKTALADVRSFKDGCNKLLTNGDGIVPPELLPEAEVAGYVRDIVAVTGGAADRSGHQGVGKEHLDRFVTKAKAWLAWNERAPEAMVWGSETESASALVSALDERIENFFLTSELLRQEQAGASLTMKEDDLRALRGRNNQGLTAWLTEAALSPPVTTATLSLDATINALYRARFDELREKVLTRVLGDDVKALTTEGWARVKAVFAPFRQWQADKIPEAFGDLGEEKVRGYLDGPLGARVEHFIALDAAEAEALAVVDELEKLLLFVQGLVELANNFVNFSAVYRPGDVALVEMGSLVIDGRRLDFCLKVADRGAHKAVASESLIYLVYAVVTEKEGGAAVYEIVAPVTAGERGRLRAGKRGIFIDLTGKEFDAQVSEIVENPISVLEAAFAPFRRAWQMVSRKVGEWVGSAASSQESAMSQQAESGVTSATSTVEQGATQTAPDAPAPAAPREGINVNALVIGGSVLVASLSGIVVGLVAMLQSVRGWLAILAVVLAVLAVFALLGWLKLRRRDMSLMFEASGWAVNAEMKITARVAQVFAFVPALPKDAVMDRSDELPPAEGEGRTARRLWVLLVLVAGGAALWHFKLRHMMH